MVNNRISGKVKLSIEDFEVLGIIGEGSYGKVFCAKDRVSERKYAIKVLDKYHIMKVSFLLVHLLQIELESRQGLPRTRYPQKAHTSKHHQTVSYFLRQSEPLLCL